MRLELDQPVDNRGIRGVPEDDSSFSQTVPSENHRMLRVLHVGKFYPPHMGGIETHLQTLCGALLGSADVRVVVSNETRGTVEEIVDSVPVARVGTLATAFSTSISPGIITRIRRSAADLVHIHLPNPTAVLAYLASGHRGRLVVTCHSDTVRQKVLGRLFDPLLYTFLQRSDAIIATSPNYVASSRALQAFRDRCHVIPLGIDVTQFQHCDAAEVRKVHESVGDRLVVSVGRLVYYKGFDVLIRAMTSVRGKLVIVGEGPLRADLERLAAERGVASKVTFTGKISHARLVALYHAADVFALASVARSEAFGIVQVEAMAAGLPVVNTRLQSGVPFVSVDGVTGLTVPPGDPQALAAAINRLLDDSALRRSFGQAGVRRATEEFSLETMLRRTLQVYDRVMAKN